MKAVTSGPDADPGGGDRRRVLDLPADAEQVGVVAGEPEHPALVAAAGGHDEVAVGDAAAQRPQRQVEPGQLRHALQCRDQVVTKLAAQDLADRIGRHRTSLRWSGGAPIARRAAVLLQTVMWR